MPEKTAHIASHKIARAQAKSLAQQARLLAAKGARLGHPEKYDVIGDQIAFLVTGALALELYLKSFMVMARGGRVTFGHNLKTLYAEFPAFLKAEFEQGFAARVPANTRYTILAIKPSATEPEAPKGPGPTYRFDSFERTLESLALAFVAYRYFFENISTEVWAHLPYPDKALVGALDAVEETYANFERGKYVGRLGSSGPG